MSAMKEQLQTISEEMGLGGEITDDVRRIAQIADEYVDDLMRYPDYNPDERFNDLMAYALRLAASYRARH